MDPLDTVVTELRALGDPARAEREKRYLKSDLLHLGVPVPAIRKIAVRAAAGRSREQTLALARDLWQEPVHEARMTAVEVLVRNWALLKARDLPIIERMIRESHTWAYVDVLAIKVVGALLWRYPRLAMTLDLWSGDENLWIRRTALLALIRGIRLGEGDLTRLSEYGDALIEEQEFFIRKALGWVLRELSKRDPDWVTAWLRPRRDRISGVTLREAVRHLPAEHRELLG
ncbi:DNA alkylation repair protein [Actinoallomurus rhizosphaericola]|uniref:DNA alkylation repair protein n=1 Tax=Actinoallomurus rhizosphaericola TaxID=2952536 RepID=UPI002092B996|nr:DNA alkylation repair protein [Actinoallomurus rhizosphaericola]MCO5999145.1 DNA alkylation repair protein [Actinoallomurus rhizosphaericola]